MREPNALLQQGRVPAAEFAIVQRLVDAPRCVEANLALANILSNSNRAAAATVHIERAVAVDGKSERVLMAAAHQARGLVAVEFAAYTFQQVIEKNDRNVEAYVGLIGMLEADGDTTSARAALELAKNLFPGDIQFRTLEAKLHADAGDYDRAIGVLQGDNLFPMEILERGRCKDKTGDFAGAWTDWMHAKHLLRTNAKHEFQQEFFDRTIAEYREIAAPARNAFIPRARRIETGPRPLFVTGFPRSGTTLTETILGCHPKIHAADELQYVYQAKALAPRLIGAGMPFPLCLVAAGAGDNAPAADMLQLYYLSKALQKIGPQKKRFDFFTDKMPLNEMELPFLLMMFPSSPIRHVRRHPLDSILSNMSHLITHGYWYASSLEACAYAYARIDDLLQHYKKHLLVSADFLEVRYEALISDPRATIDAMLPAGVKPHAACYDHAKSGRRSRTISYRDIQTPIYDRSVGRWKNYRAQLAPIVPTIRHICEREGYEL